MSEAPPFNVLVVGDVFSVEMRPVEECVARLARRGFGVRVAPDILEAIRKSSADAWRADLAVICQHTPDEYTAADVRQLLGAFPLARVVCCYGSWCASDGRTRDVWPLAVRVPVTSAARRIGLELDVLAGDRRPLPLTAARDEIFLFDPDEAIEAPTE
jgi:hypothetical protein